MVETNLCWKICGTPKKYFLCIFLLVLKSLYIVLSLCAISKSSARLPRAAGARDAAVSVVLVVD